MAELNLSPIYEPRKHSGSMPVSGQDAYYFSVGAETDECRVPYDLGSNTAIYSSASLPQQFHCNLGGIFNEQPFASCFEIRRAMPLSNKAIVFSTLCIGEVDMISSASVVENEASPTISRTNETEETQALTLLKAIVTAPSKRLNDLFDLARSVAPQTILNTALDEYRISGGERYLSMAVSILQNMGDKAWPALRDLARSAPEEAELFVPIIADCINVALNERINALMHLAASRHANVRAAVLENLTELPKERVNAIVRILANTPQRKSKE